MARAERFGELRCMFIAERRRGPNEADNFPDIVVGMCRSKSWHPRQANSVLDYPEQLSVGANGE